MQTSPPLWEASVGEMGAGSRTPVCPSVASRTEEPHPVDNQTDKSCSPPPPLPSSPTGTWAPEARRQDANTAAIASAAASIHPSTSRARLGRRTGSSLPRSSTHRAA
ncbi:unnamed protein product [Protopolystoma xenopodis]|uniref:Uncharacterized protein n=1 Tax=Protopolystoma xenopodis TaxID=117903 RepID=A0A3S5BIB5_9PLAT|nr:unnamed protein product [Protopolystoma xenopodis]